MIDISCRYFLWKPSTNQMNIYMGHRDVCQRCESVKSTKYNKRLEIVESAPDETINTAWCPDQRRMMRSSLAEGVACLAYKGTWLYACLSQTQQLVARLYLWLMVLPKAAGVNSSTARLRRTETFCRVSWCSIYWSRFCHFLWRCRLTIDQETDFWMNFLSKFQTKVK